MAKIKDACIANIRMKVPIEQLIGDYVVLKRSGSTLKGLSPFSQEKTPSFTVNPQKGFYYCFSTSQGGDIFTFVQKLENLNFGEAVEFIAKKYSIPLEYDYVGQDAINASINKQLFDMHEIAASWFSEQFFAKTPQAEAIRQYWLNERKMSLDDAKELRIGYAPENSAELKKIFASKRYSLEAIAKSSIFLARESERNFANFYPKFRGRMMIPICDIQGRVVGFTARKTQFTPDIPAESGKYVNSKETDIFKKGNIAFNLHKAKNFIKEQDACVLVEGQLDAIKMYASGIKNVIATQGTALTDNHLMLIKRFCNRAILLFDGDSAGIRANMKAISMCLKHELEPFVVPLPQGEDPDSFICKFGAEAMQELIDNKKRTAISFAAKTLSRLEGELTAQKVGKIVFDIFSMLINCKSKIILNEYLREVSSNLGISYSSIANDFENFAKNNSEKKSNFSKENDQKHEYKISTAPADALMIALLYSEVGNAMANAIAPEWLSENKLSCKILLKLFAIYKEGISIELSELSNFFDDEREKNAIYKILANEKISIENPVKSANNCISTIYKNYIEREIENANKKISDLETSNSEKILLLKKITELRKKAQKAPNLIEEF